MIHQGHDVRLDFPLLQHHPDLVYLDNAATTQKPRVVLDAMEHFYVHDNANVHRGVHRLSARATEAYEGARDTIAAWINARDRREVVFCRGATEAINLVAHSFARPRLSPGDHIIVSEMGHHANIVPWQLVTAERQAKIQVLPMEDGNLRPETLQRLINERTQLVALGHISNALGTIHPVAELIEVAHQHGVPVLVDGVQALPHQAVDVSALGADFYVFSGHKMYGPSGIGILYGQAHHLEAMAPYQGGGDMITSVDMHQATYHEIPYKFEAGTQALAAVVGLAAACRYLDDLGLAAIQAHEQPLYRYARESLQALPFVQVVGANQHNAGIISMVIDAIHPHDVGTLLDAQGIAVRTGHHCAMPLMQALGVSATVRASCALYNRREDIDALVAALQQLWAQWS